MRYVFYEGTGYIIKKSFYKNNKELFNLILKTDSFDSEEKQYWYHMLPTMTKEQVQRLYDILKNEKDELDRINIEYQNGYKEINQEILADLGNYLKNLEEFLNQ